MINVENGKIVGWIGEGFVYIGRNSYGMKGSALANKFVIGKDGDRAEVIAKYRIWLWAVVQEKNSKAWDEICELVEKYENGEELSLVCWCKPQACHGDVIKSCIEYLSK